MYSGKCDLADTLLINSDGDINKIDFSNYEFYTSFNQIIPLRIDNMKDVVPYFPFLVSMS